MVLLGAQAVLQRGLLGRGRESQQAGQARLKVDTSNVEGIRLKRALLERAWMEE